MHGNSGHLHYYTMMMKMQLTPKSLETETHQIKRVDQSQSKYLSCLQSY